MRQIVFSLCHWEHKGSERLCSLSRITQPSEFETSSQPCSPALLLLPTEWRQAIWTKGTGSAPGQELVFLKQGECGCFGVRQAGVVLGVLFSFSELR